jgi:general secretion pathway protein H
MPKGEKTKTKTSAITDARTIDAQERAQSGFTLLELLVVLIILSIALSVTVSFVGKANLGDDLKLASRKVIAAARQARLAAISENREVLFEIDSKSRTLGADDFVRKSSLPDSINIKAVTAKSEQTTPSRAGVRFFPDGGSTGGRVTLSDGNRKISVMIDWLSGRTFVEEPDGEK